MFFSTAMWSQPAAAAEFESVSVHAFFDATVRVPPGTRVEDTADILGIVDGGRVILVQHSGGGTCDEDRPAPGPASRAPAAGYAYWTELGGSGWSTCADVPGGVLEVFSADPPPSAGVLDVLLGDLLAAQRAAPALEARNTVDVELFFPHATLRVPPSLTSVEDDAEFLHFQGTTSVVLVRRYPDTTCADQNPLADEPDLVPPTREPPPGYATWAETDGALWATCSDVPGGILVVLGNGAWRSHLHLDEFLGDVLDAQRAAPAVGDRPPAVPRPAPPHASKAGRPADPALGIRAASAFARLPGVGGMDTPFGAGVGANLLGFVKGQPLFGAAEVAVGYGGGLVFDAGVDFGPMFWVGEVFVGSFVGLHADATIGFVPFGLRAPIGVAVGRLSDDQVSVVGAVEGDWVFASDAVRAVPDAALGWDESTLGLMIAVPGARSVLFGVERRHVVQGSAWSLTVGLGRVGGR